MPTPESPILDIERFAEGYLGAELDQHAELPAELLGVTHFRPGRRPWIEINRDLTLAAVDDDAGPLWVKGRWRATLAHESSHVVLHEQFVQPDSGQQELWGEDPSSPSDVRLQRCLKRDFGVTTRRADRKEVQANIGMAALLMPRRVLVAVACPLLRQISRRSGTADLTAEQIEELVHELAGLFQVSRQAARIRVQTLRLRSILAQRELGL
jgi:hypothetical protein